MVAAAAVVGDGDGGAGIDRQLVAGFLCRITCLVADIGGDGVAAAIGQLGDISLRNSHAPAVAVHLALVMHAIEHHIHGLAVFGTGGGTADGQRQLLLYRVDDIIASQAAINTDGRCLQVQVIAVVCAGITAVATNAAGGNAGVDVAVVLQVIAADSNAVAQLAVTQIQYLAIGVVAIHGQRHRVANLDVTTHGAGHSDGATVGFLDVQHIVGSHRINRDAGLGRCQVNQVVMIGGGGSGVVIAVAHAYRSVDFGGTGQIAGTHINGEAQLAVDVDHFGFVERTANIQRHLVVQLGISTHRAGDGDDIAIEFIDVEDVVGGDVVHRDGGFRCRDMYAQVMLGGRRTVTGQVMDIGGDGIGLAICQIA